MWQNKCLSRAWTFQESNHAFPRKHASISDPTMTLRSDLGVSLTDLRFLEHPFESIISGTLFTTMVAVLSGAVFVLARAYNRNVIGWFRPIFYCVDENPTAFKRQSSTSESATSLLISQTDPFTETNTLQETPHHSRLRQATGRSNTIDRASIKTTIREWPLGRQASPIGKVNESEIARRRKASRLNQRWSS